MIFSIILPIYKENYKDYHDLLSSILSNSYKDYEIIVIDDTIYNKENKFKDLAVSVGAKYYNNKKKLGLSMSCNLGLTFAKGKYVIFLNCDNIIQSDFLIKANKKLTKNNVDTMMLYNRVLNSKNKFGQFVHSQSVKNILNGDRVKKLFNFNFLSYTEGFIVKKKLLEISGGFYDHNENFLKAGEDFIFANELRKIKNLNSIIDFSLNVSHTVPDEIDTFYHNRYIRGYGTPQIRYYYYNESLVQCNLFFILKNLIKLFFILIFPLYIYKNISFYNYFVNKKYLKLFEYFKIKIIEDIAIIHGEIFSLLKINLFYRKKKLINLNDIKNIKS